MGWFKRFKEGIQTATKNKKEAPDGLWYKCKNCGHHYVIGDKRSKYSMRDRLLSLKLYRRGMSLRAVAEIVKTNNVTVLKWIRKFGKELKEQILSMSMNEVVSGDVIEIDEIWHYCKKNKENYGFGLLILGSEEKSLPLKSVLVDLNP